MKLNRSLSDLFEHDDDDVIYDPDTFYQEYDYQRPVEYVDILGSAGPSSHGGFHTSGRRGSMTDSVFMGASTRRGSMTDSFFTTGGTSLSKRSSTMNGSSRRSSLTNSFADSSFYWNESIRGAPNTTNLHSSSPDDLLLDDQSVSEHHDFDSELNNSLQKIGNSSLSSNTIKLCELSNDSKSSFLSPEYKKMRNTQSRKGKYLPGSLEMGGSLHTPSSSRQFYQQQQQHQQPLMKQRRRNSTNSQTIAGSSSVIQDHRREIEKILLQAGKVAEQVANSTNTTNSNNSKSFLSRFSSGNATSSNRNTSINTPTTNSNTKSTIPSNTIPPSNTKRPEVRRSRSSNTQTKSPILKMKYQAVDEDTDASTISTTMTPQPMESKVIISLHVMKQFHQNNNKKNQSNSNHYHYHHNHHHPQQRHGANPANPTNNSRKPRQSNESYDSPVISLSSGSGSSPVHPSPIATTISSRHSNTSNQRPDLAPKLPSRCRSPVRSSTVTVPT